MTSPDEPILTPTRAREIFLAAGFAAEHVEAVLAANDVEIDEKCYGALTKKLVAAEREATLRAVGDPDGDPLTSLALIQEASQRAQLRASRLSEHRDDLVLAGILAGKNLYRCSKALGIAPATSYNIVRRLEAREDGRLVRIDATRVTAEEAAQTIENALRESYGTVHVALSHTQDGADVMNAAETVARAHKKRVDLHIV